jgi:hypothetical protein
MSIIVHDEEKLLRSLIDTGARISIILGAYILSQLIKTDDNDTNTWSIMGVNFTTNKTGMMLVKFSLPEFNLKKQMCSSWEFHEDDRHESSSTYDMIIGNQK